MKVNKQDRRTIWLDPQDPHIVRVFDQRLLPWKIVEEPLCRPEDAIRAIREMYVRGAGLIGATAGYGMYLATLAAPVNDDAGFMEYMERYGEELNAARPTARNLKWAIDRMLAAIRPAVGAKEKQQAARQAAGEIAAEDADFCRRIGLHGRELIRAISEKKKGERVNILTHCNAGWLAFVDYGSVTAPIYAARDAGIDLHVYVDETRPWNQGARLTVWELQQEEIPCTLICDNTGGHLMQRGMVDMVIVGSDRTTHTGDVANKIGTYLKALAARDNNIPFYVALPSSTIDWEMDSGSQIPIEKRSPEEVTSVMGVDAAGRIQTLRIAAEGTEALNYSFDVTPARLVSALITERGVTAADQESIHALFGR
ncbi:MAG: S-methyl-5-thioribose-1-phosphate isomerase [Desulforhopalus sp.]|nr:S-methyl-5-thioribose-1-phosphate isomerase [Desulforhopalus sp.]